MEEASVSDDLQPRSSQMCDVTSPCSLSADFELQANNATLKKSDLNRDILMKELSRIQHIGPQSSAAHNISFQYPTGQVSRNCHQLPMSSARDYDAHQRQCESSMPETQTLKKQHEHEKSVQESEFYRHRSVLPKLDISSHEKHMLRPKFSDGLPKQRLDDDLMNKGPPREEDRMDMGDLRRQQEAVVKGASTNETLNQLYVNTLRKCEAIKDEHDSLRKRYADLIASHSAAISKLELAQEEMTRLRKQYEESVQEKNSAVRERNVLKSQCTHAIMQWDIAIRERNTFMDYLAKMQLQHEEEMNKGMAVRIKSTKDLKRLTEERNAAMEEYSLVMRERDTVHKEIEKLQDDLMQSNEKNKSLEAKNIELTEEKKLLECKVESLHREIKSALEERDIALKDLYDVRGRYGEHQEHQWVDNSFVDRSDRGMRFNNPKVGAEQSNKKSEQVFSKPGETYLGVEDQEEVHLIRKELGKAQDELLEALQEIEVSKHRRDWAFSERDKAVLERESIRALCDRLRRERDRAVSDLAEALRESDEVKRLKNDVSKELKDLREKFGEIQIEKESEKQARPPLNHSYDSALGPDVSDGETEIVELAMDWNTHTLDFGFSLAGGSGRSLTNNDQGLYVTAVTPGGPADGKLHVNDSLIKIGGISCSASDPDTVWNVIRTAKSPVTLTLRRRKSSIPQFYSIRLICGNSESHGIVLEHAVVVRSIAPGSAAARQGLLRNGDRLCSVNGTAISSMNSLDQVYGLLERCFREEDEVMITLLRGVSNYTSEYPLSTISINSPSTSSTVNIETEEESDINMYSPRRLRNQGPNADDSGNRTRSTRDSLRESVDRPRCGMKHSNSCRISDRRPMEAEPLNSKPIEDDEGGVPRSDINLYDKFNMRRSNNAKEYEKTDNRQPHVPHNNNEDTDTNFVSLGRKKRLNSTTKHDSESKSTKNGGTWPRCRVNYLCEENYQGVNVFHSYKCPRTRLPLSVFLDDAKSSKHLANEHQTDYENDQPGEDLSAYENRVGVASADPPSDGSIDLSVQSGNLGKEDLGRYLKKTSNPSSGLHSETDVELRRNRQLVSPLGLQQASAIPPVLVPSSSSLHNHSSPPITSHLRIQSQLYPSTLHSTLKYQVNHVHDHTHILPTRFSPASSESPYDLSIRDCTIGDRPFTHTVSSSISSMYSRHPNHSHEHPPTSVSYTIGNTLTRQPDPTPFAENVANMRKEPTRIRIPSYPSVTSRSSTGKISCNSVEGLSDHGSPMPNFHVEILSPGRSGTATRSDNRSSVNDYSWSSATGAGPKFKPAPDELRRVYIEKSSEPLGIQIFCPNSGGVFVSSVNQASLAEQVGLQVGDQLLEVCGINMRSATYQLAACVLHQCGDSITMLVQYNPTKYKEQQMSEIELGDGPSVINSSSSECDDNRESRPKSVAASLTPCNSPCHDVVPQNSNPTHEEDIRSSENSTLRSHLNLDRRLVERASETRSSTMRPTSMHGVLSRHHTHATLPRSTSAASSAGLHGDKLHVQEHEPRLIYFETNRTNSLGISLVGGNAVGIFVHSVQVDSPAFKAGLRCGDRILEFNGISLRQSTAEQAAYELAKSTDKITMIVVHDMERYSQIVELPGDSFYVRAQFEKQMNGNYDEMELSFHRDDILYIDNTMFNGVPGMWRAWLINNEGQKVKCGIIPSKYKIEEDYLQRSSLADLDHESRRSSTSARRSFFRRRKHTRSSSRDSKELASFSDSSFQLSSSEGLGHQSVLPLADSSMPRPLSYVHVERYDCHVMRPVLIVGPLSDLVGDKLVLEFTRKFTKVLPECVPYSQSFLPNLTEESDIVEYRRRGSHYECITVAAIQDVGSKNLHGILDISLNAVPQLHRKGSFPIVVLLKFKSVKHVREVKDTRFSSDKTAAKAAKEMFEHVIKVEAEHRHLISAIIPAGGNLAYICTQVAAVVDQEQSKMLWVPSDFVW